MPSGWNADGGGFFVFSSGNTTLTDNTFSDNSADSDGAGVSIETDSGDVTLTNNTFDNNSAGSDGGGVRIDNEEGNTTLTNNTFTNNSAPITGGGARVVFTSAGILMIINNTLTLNSTGGRGGGLFVSLDDDAATASIFNNIVRDNTATGDGDDIFVFDDANRNNTGSPVNLFNNDFSDFFSDCDSRPLFCESNISEGNNINEDPLFVNAADGDVHLQEGSPCIDAGDPNAPALPATDFEGDPRDVDGDGDGTTPDMGADEFIPTVDRGGDGGGCSLAQSGVPTSIPLYFLVPIFVVVRRLLKRHRIN